MKWFTHQCLAVVAAASLGMPAPAVAGAFAGAVLPDVIDSRLAAVSRRPRQTFNRIHRGASHWFGWYLGLCVLLPAVPLSGNSGVQGALPVLATGAAYGALAHVVLDMLTPAGVPLTPFSRKRKISLAICATGSIREYIFLGACLMAAWLLAGERLGRSFAVGGVL